MVYGEVEKGMESIMEIVQAWVDGIDNRFAETTKGKGCKMLLIENCKFPVHLITHI